MSDRVIKWILSSVICMNAVDAILSLIYIKHLSILEEANPFAETLMSLGDIPFVICKSLMVGSGVLILWKLRKNKLAKLGVVLSFVTYFILMVAFCLFLF